MHMGNELEPGPRSFGMSIASERGVGLGHLILSRETRAMARRVGWGGSTRG